MEASEKPSDSTGEAPLLSLVKPWRVLSERDLAATRVFTLRERQMRSQQSEKGGAFVYLDCADWANIVALTADRRVVMIEQYRHGLSEITLELPGGIVDPGESPAEGMRRELREETGYDGQWRGIIGVCSANPAIQNNRVHTGLIEHATQVHAVELDGNEEIGVRLVPLGEIPELIRRGVIHHSLIIAAFHYLALTS